MSTTVFLAVIFAALLHASWNAVVKGGLDKRTSMAAVIIGGIPFAAAGAAVSPIPAVESWPYLAVGVFLHLGYQYFLMQSYRIGDLTQVYPIARGSAPLIVTLVSVTFLGVHLEALELLGVAIIGTGIISLALVRRADGQRNPRAGALALTTGLFIASYSLVDGLGAREAGTSLGFYGWMATINGLIMAAYFALRTPETLHTLAREGKTVGLLGGGASFVAYALVTWAFTQAPIALVTALRETSIVFALLIGVFFLKERLDLAKVASTMMTLLGAVLVRIAR
jgi:drug/metabolite transporter (DMT)-like permease